MSITFNNLAFSVDANAKPISTNSSWSIADYMGALKVRSTLKRNKYFVEPGLYKLGEPSSESEVFVSANYKLSFDVLRRNLRGLNAWVIVLNTKGVNVWCAAGKSSFGTDELINRINATGIKNRISHKRIIVPQLGAPGIAAHMVKQATGLTVKYGPVRATDIKAYLGNNLEATPEMRQVKFSFWDRLQLVPVEVAYSAKYLLLSMLVFLILSGIEGFNYHVQNLYTEGIKASFAVLLLFCSGTVLGPLLLPVLPFRALALKGLFAGLLMWVLLYLSWFNQAISVKSISYLLAALALGSFFTMNFTGATTYTSLSGVKKEMKYAIPAQIFAGVSSVLLYVISKLV